MTGLFTFITNFATSVDERAQRKNPERNLTELSITLKFQGVSQLVEINWQIVIVHLQTTKKLQWSY